MTACMAEDETGRLVAFGEQADGMQGRVPPGILLSRPVQEGRVADLDATKLLIEKLLSSSRHGVVMGPRMMIAVASHLGPLERKTVEEVARAAGARKVALVDSCPPGRAAQKRDRSGRALVLHRPQSDCGRM